MSRVLQNPSPFFEVRRGIDLEENTTWELAAALQTSGFTWDLFPKGELARRALPPYQPGDPESIRRWYSTGTTVCKEYMLCLLRAPDLLKRHKIQAIPHWASKPRVYQLLLQGEVVDDPYVAPLECDRRPDGQLARKPQSRGPGRNQDKPPMGHGSSLFSWKALNIYIAGICLRVGCLGGPSQLISLCARCWYALCALLVWRFAVSVRHV